MGLQGWSVMLGVMWGVTTGAGRACSFGGRGLFRGCDALGFCADGRASKCLRVGLGYWFLPGAIVMRIDSVVRDGRF